MARKLHILEVNKFYPPHIGGIETAVAQRARLLTQREDCEVKVLVCQAKGKGITELVDGIEVTRSGSLGTYFSCPLSLTFFKNFKQLAQWADVIECNLPFPLVDVAVLLFRYKGRVVVTWHSDVVKQKKLLLLYKPILLRFLKRANAILVATQGHIDSSPYIGQHREKSHIVPYAIEADRYDCIKKQPILTERLTKSNHTKLLFVGRLVYYKGVDVLLQAMRLVNGAELFLVGKGVLEEDLREDAKDLPVHFLGNLSDTALKCAFADCDVFVFPSVENSEAFGIVQQEAMVYGKPVINTNLPTGVPYVSLDDVTGITVPVRDSKALAQAIQTLVDHPELRAKYGKNAYMRARTIYDPTTITETVYHVLKGDTL